LPNPSSTLRGTWYRQLTCIPDQASLKVNGCQEIAVKVDIVVSGRRESNERDAIHPIP